MVTLENTFFFHGHNVAFETINDLKQGNLPESLTDFLSNSLSKANAKNMKLAIQDK